jgi:hypothetical protein
VIDAKTSADIEAA